MTITIRKLHLAIAVLAVALIAPATAFAAHVFTDVPDDAFYADPVEWAFENDITTGKSPTSFAPLDNVTRGESVTFLKRYNDNIVEPAVASAAVAHATVLSDGSVVAARSRGVTDENVTLEDGGSAFCFYDLDFDFLVVQASPLYLWATSREVDTSIEIGYPDVLEGTADCTGDDPLLEIATVDDSVWTAHGFTVTFFG
jgi:hypothetical protein